MEWRFIANSIDAGAMRQVLEIKRANIHKQRLASSVSEEEANQTPYTIDTHKHNFAVWAAARAAQRGLTSVDKLRNALEVSGVKDAVIRIGNRNVDPTEYDGWHRDWCRRIVKDLLDAGVKKATYGRAAKLVAVYLKVMVIVGGDPICPFAITAHPPIDRILLQNIAKSNPRLRDLSKVNWTNLSEDKYFDVVKKLRDVLDEGTPFWEMEKYWTVTDD